MDTPPFEPDLDLIDDHEYIPGPVWLWVAVAFMLGILAILML